jgi:hypothetical protein
LIKDTISPAIAKIFCWLVLSYGGTRPWNKFEHKIECGLKAADRVVKRSLADSHCPTELHITIINLNLYLDMLLLCLDYDRHGGPTLGEEPEDVLREAREPNGRKIPTNNIEILASRLAHALELLRKVMWGDWQHLFSSVLPEGCECEYPIHQEAGVEADIDESALFSNTRTKENARKTSKAPSREFNLWADMDNLSQALQTALKIQEELLQFLNNKDRLESNIKSETIQGSKPRTNSEVRSEVKPAVKLEIGSELEEELKNEKREINKSAPEGDEKKDGRSKPTLTLDTKIISPQPSAGMPNPSVDSSSDAIALFTPSSGSTPIDWTSRSSDEDFQSRRFEQREKHDRKQQGGMG